jgi:D-glycero-D-manno-heptose 1,7-bisphosphate phosphatase
MMQTIFLYRDGVIIENRDSYVRSWNDVYIYPQALEALAKFRHMPLYFVIVTNQSAVGRGIISKQEADTINSRLVDEIANSGGRIDAVFMCPHAPFDNCGCRKPKPGLFLQAAQTLSLNLNKSVMIGDALTDLVAAKTAGVNQNVLVRTGRGEKQSNLIEAQSIAPFSTYDTLLDAFINLFR